MEISESMSINDLLDIVFDYENHSAVERMYACQCIKHKFEAAQQGGQDDCLLGGKHEWQQKSNGEYMKTFCGKCGKRH